MGNKTIILSKDCWSLSLMVRLNHNGGLFLDIRKVLAQSLEKIKHPAISINALLVILLQGEVVGVGIVYEITVKVPVKASLEESQQKIISNLGKLLKNSCLEITIYSEKDYSFWVISKKENLNFI